MGTPDGRGLAALEREVLAVLVLYGRTADESVTLRSLREGLRRLGARLDVFVYDNSPSASPPAQAAEWRMEYRHDPSNPGVSRAYLEGAQLAAARRKRWLLLLDQDTSFPPDAMAVYAQALQRNPTEALFAPVLRSGRRIVSPCGYRFPRGVPLRTVQSGPQPLAGKSILNSGMCISLAAYQRTGGHDPRIGLDFSDHEFIDRFRRTHDRAYILPVECLHGFSGDDTAGVASGLLRFEFYCRGARYAGP